MNAWTRAVAVDLKMMGSVWVIFKMIPIYLALVVRYMVLLFTNLENIRWGFREGVAAAAKLLQSCPTLCDPTDGSPPGSPIPGILQARTLEWVATSFSNAWKWKVKVKSRSPVWLFATPWTAAYQAPLSLGFSRQEYWSGVPLPSPREGVKWVRFWTYWIWDTCVSGWTVQ